MVRLNVSTIARHSISAIGFHPIANGESFVDLDSHADTCVLGNNALMVETPHPPRTAIVSFADPSMGSVEKPILSGALLYTSTTTGKSVILIIHQAIHIDSMEHSLLCPMQLRDNDVFVDECPKSKAENPTIDTHTIRATSSDGTTVRFPLRLRGVTSTLVVSKPTLAQYNECDHVVLTSADLLWDPHSNDYELAEETFFAGDGEYKAPGDRDRQYQDFIIKAVRSTLGKVPKEHRETKPIWSVAALNSLSDRASHHTLGCAVLNSIDPTLNDGTFGRKLADNRVIMEVGRPLGRKTSGYKSVGPEHLAKKWHCSLNQAEQTLKVTTQRGTRTILKGSLTRRYKTNDRMLRYRRLPHVIFTDTLKSKVLSKRQNRKAQVYTTEFHWSRAFPMKTEKETHETVSKMFKDTGVPTKIVCDGAKSQIMGEFRRKCREADCPVQQTEPHSPWTNAAESAIRELKRATGRRMTATRTPKRLWDDCMELTALIRSHTALDIWQLAGQTPETLMTGQTPDISHLLEFDWFDWVMYYDSETKFPEDSEVLGRWLGPAQDIGPMMCSKIQKPNGNCYYTSTYRALTPEEMRDPAIDADKKKFMDELYNKLGPEPSDGDFEDELRDSNTPSFPPYEDTDVDPTVIPDRDEYPDFEKYIGAEVLLPKEGELQTAKVKARKKDHDGEPIGRSHTNPMFDTRCYIVEFADGIEKEYTANLIAENMYSQCNPDGEQYLILLGITDHRKTDKAVEKADAHIYKGGRRYPRKTTKGWQLCVSWKDGTTTWESLASLKESNPIQVAEYAIAMGIDAEPAFHWWVPYTLKTRNRLIARVNTRYHKRTHKFGFEVPKTVERALAIDKENGDNRWETAINKEMGKVRVAFKVQTGKDPPVGYSYVGCHLVFDVKMESFQCKARMCCNGNETGPPASLTYASVVSRESVRIALTYAALNDLEVKTSDVENAFLTAPTEERLYTTLGPEFGEDQGKHATIVRALYGMKSSGAAFRNHLADCMRHLKYVPCPADPDVWMQEFTKPDGTRYYGYMLLYVDDALCINHKAEEQLRKLDHYFKMKPDSIGDPNLYLGAKIGAFDVEDNAGRSTSAWGLSPTKYVHSAIKNVEEYLLTKGKALPKKNVNAPFPRGYRPELDITPELDDELANYYQSQVGILRWMVELGRTDIITEVSELASQLACPREGHLEVVFRVYAYLKHKRNTLMLFDPSYPTIDDIKFIKRDWNNFYGDVKEMLPPDAPKPLGKEVILRLFVDADYAGNEMDRRSRTGFIVFLNNAPILWHSKKQTRVENSVFGSEFIAMRTGLEVVQGIRYKLRMMGIPLNTPTYVYGDNMSVIHNTSKPESTLKKKANSVCYHYIRECIAAGEALTAHIATHQNPSDTCTKCLPAGEKRDYLNGMILHFFDPESNERE